MNVISNLKTSLNQQLYGNGNCFKLLEEKLGAELVDSIPTITLPKTEFEGDYPQPWDKPTNMPADVVKGVFSSGRPFLAMRFVVAKTNTLAMEIFFQRYSGKMPVAINSVMFSPEGLIQAVQIPVQCSGLERNWSSTDVNCGRSAIHPAGGVTNENFATIKAILSGSSLKETGGRYLPLYAEKYAKEMAAAKAVQPKK